MDYFRILFAVLSIALSGSSALGASSWPMFQHDAYHTGRADVTVPASPQLLWERDEGFHLSDHLVLGDDDCLWLMGSSMRKISKEGECLLNIRAIEGAFCVAGGAPAVLEDGALVALAQARDENQELVPWLYLIEDTGTVRWTLPLEGNTDHGSLITLGPQETIYCACAERVYAISSSGAIDWSYSCGSEVSAIPGCAADGTVYFGTEDGVLYSLSSQGVLNWTFATGNGSSILSAPTTDEHGNVYFVASREAFYRLRSDGSVAFSYPVSRFSYTSPVLLGDGSVVFCGGQRGGPCEVICIDSAGNERWKTGLIGDQDPLRSPVADKDGNLYIAYMSYESGPTMTFYLHLGRIDTAGNYQELATRTSQAYSGAGGLCIGADGTLYLYLASMLCAFGEPGESLSMGISTGLSTVDVQLGWIRQCSVWLDNPLSGIDLDLYIAYRRAGNDELLFYPFWSNESIGCALEFRPLPAGAQFPKIELIHLPESSFEPGEYEWLAGLFEPGTFNSLCEIATCEFSVYAQPIRGSDSGLTQQTSTAIGLALQGTPPTIQVWTDKLDYTAGETLNLSLGIDNQGLGMPFDLYIAATMDADPSGTLYFFPTWATDPSFTNISFLPMAQGASLPDWTIMHLELPDALPRGGYKFLAAFFQAGTFELSSEIAEASWTLM